MTKEEYINTFSEEESVGWFYLDQQLATVYEGEEPRHYAAKVPYVTGGPDPLDGISIYTSQEQMTHFHLVSYGMSELYYDTELVGGDYSKWGIEFTFRLKPFEGDEGDPLWVIELMNNLARYVFESGNWFEENHFVPVNECIRVDTDSEIVGLIFVKDPELGTIQTPHGEVTFLQMVGITAKELEPLLENPTVEAVEELAETLKKENPLLITDLNRT
ncbi:suppressor of fused domain protein [Aureispira anguillae]|uniref:Suppressor of fused domain protein n=1 Tax=Aureispira anguillae TaxID=2864201 RepID=A0A915YHM8_9BACT|nr:suppressor of fused domain protein [Aureispira anguillae]BDS13141.1 suppressor of fused domain protein [Aureispira anguillae]